MIEHQLSDLQYKEGWRFKRKQVVCATGKMIMKRLRLLCALIGFTSLPVLADMASSNKDAFVTNLIDQMTLEEKIGQLRLIAIDENMTPEKIRQEIAAVRPLNSIASISQLEANARPMGKMVRWPWITSQPKNIGIFRRLC